MGHKRTLASSLFLVSILALFSFSRCDTGERVLPSANGRPGDIMVVIDSVLLETPAGLALKECLEVDQPGMLQAIPILSVHYYSKEFFKGGMLSQRNIILVKGTSGDTPAKLNFRKDVWAKGQTVLEITGSTNKELRDQIAGNSNEIRNFFLQNERDFINYNHQQNSEPYIWNTMAKKHGVSVLAPKGYFFAVDTPGFVWLRRETAQTDRGLLVYYFDYNTDSAFTQGEILKVRNEMTRKYIPGEKEDSYMVTDTVREKYRNVSSLKGNYAIETRGLWTMRNEFMGGPFISYSIVDTVRNRVLCFDGFTYVAKTGSDWRTLEDDKRKKREFLRELEAIIHSFEFQ